MEIRILKMCQEPLASILCTMFQQSLYKAFIPSIWKTSEIIHIQYQKNHHLCVRITTDWLALTSVIIKCTEKIVEDKLLDQVGNLVDNY